MVVKTMQTKNKIYLSWEKAAACPVCGAKSLTQLPIDQAKHIILCSVCNTKFRVELNPSD